MPDLSGGYYKDSEKHVDRTSYLIGTYNNIIDIASNLDCWIFKKKNHCFPMVQE